MPVEDALTEAEAAAIEGSFADIMGTHIESHCNQCTYRPCWCVVRPDDVDQFGEADADGEPDFDDGDGGPTLPADDPGPGGGGPGPGPGGGPNGDQDGDGIPNKDDCDSPLFTGTGPCGQDACADDDGDGVKNQDDCKSECYEGDPSECCEQGCVGYMPVVEILYVPN